MDTSTIIVELQAERDRLDKAVAVLKGIHRGPARSAFGKRDGGKRQMSAAARKKIGEAMKALG